MARQFADDTATMYERAITLLKNNIMLYFAYADYEEGRCKYVKVHSIYKKLISLEGIDPTLVGRIFAYSLLFLNGSLKYIGHFNFLQSLNSYKGQTVSSLIYVPVLDM